MQVSGLVVAALLARDRGKGAKESAMFTVTEPNTNGTGRATTKVATLKGTK